MQNLRTVQLMNTANHPDPTTNTTTHHIWLITVFFYLPITISNSPVSIFLLLFFFYYQLQLQYYY